MYLARRLLRAVPVLFAAAFLVFVLIDFLPGDPSITRLGQPTDRAERLAWLAANGYNDPIFIRYIRYLFDVAQGNFGFTLVSRQPILQVIRDSAPVTLQLTAGATVVALVVSGALGSISALKRSSRLGSAASSLSSLLMALPAYWIAMMAVLLLSVNLGWLPSGGYVSPTDDLLGWASSMVLPVVMLALPVAGALARVIRTSILGELEKDYIKFARAQGMSTAAVLRQHLLKNAAVSPVTVLGLYVGYLLAGAALIETAMSLPGLGRVLVDAALKSDIWTLRAVAVMTAAAFLLITAFVDLGRWLLDPRVRDPA